MSFHPVLMLCVHVVPFGINVGFQTRLGFVSSRRVRHGVLVEQGFSFPSLCHRVVLS